MRDTVCRWKKINLLHQIIIKNFLAAENDDFWFVRLPLIDLFFIFGKFATWPNFFSSAEFVCVGSVPWVGECVMCEIEIDS